MPRQGSGTISLHFNLDLWSVRQRLLMVGNLEHGPGIMIRRRGEVGGLQQSALLAGLVRGELVTRLNEIQRLWVVVALAGVTLALIYPYYVSRRSMERYLHERGRIEREMKRPECAPYLSFTPGELPPIGLCRHLIQARLALDKNRAIPFDLGEYDRARTEARQNRYNRDVWFSLALVVGGSMLVYALALVVA